MLTQNEIDQIDGILNSAAAIGKPNADEKEEARTFLLDKADQHKTDGTVATSHRNSNIVSATVARVANGSVVVRSRGYRKSGLAIMFGITLQGDAV